MVLWKLRNAPEPQSFWSTSVHVPRWISFGSSPLALAELQDSGILYVPSIFEPLRVIAFFVEVCLFTLYHSDFMFQLQMIQCAQQTRRQLGAWMPPNWPLLPKARYVH